MNDTVNTGTPAPGTGDAIQAGTGDSGSAQSAERQEFHTLREKMVGKDYIPNIQDKQRFTQLNEKLHFGGKDTTDKQSTGDPNAPHTEPSAFKSEVSRHFAPAQSPEDYTLDGDLPAWASVEQLQHAKELLHTLQLPAQAGTEILGRVMHHLQSQVDATGAPSLDRLDEAGVMGYVKLAVAKDFGGSLANFWEAAKKAEYYLHTTLSPEQYSTIQDSYWSTSLETDPFIIKRLANLFDSKGMVLDS